MGEVAVFCGYPKLALCKIVFLDFIHHLGFLKNHNILEVGSASVFK
jgi:hypothetical protein